MQVASTKKSPETFCGKRCSIWAMTVGFGSVAKGSRALEETESAHDCAAELQGEATERPQRRDRSAPGLQNTRLFLAVPPRHALGVGFADIELTGRPVR